MEVNKEAGKEARFRAVILENIETVEERLIMTLGRLSQLEESDFENDESLHNYVGAMKDLGLALSELRVLRGLPKHWGF